MDFLWRITGGNGAETDVHHVISSLRKDVESLTADIRQKEEDQHILETERSTIFESSQRSLEQAFDIHTSIEKANAVRVHMSLFRSPLFFFFQCTRTDIDNSLAFNISISLPIWLCIFSQLYFSRAL